jgi:RNA polymerase sigma-B factor
MTMPTVPTSLFEPRPAAAPTPRSTTGRAALRAAAVDAENHALATLRTDPAATTECLLRARRRLPAGHADRALLRTRAIENNLPLASRLARRYAGRGERLEDLVQVAALALVKAVDGYDPDRLTSFVGYAMPTIIGGLKRHFRDTAWGMRVPRATQELVLGLPATVNHLTHLRGRTPTPVELADHLGIDLDVLLAAVHAAQAYRLPSLNETVTGTDAAERIDLIGATDPHFGGVDDRLALGPLVAALPVRERRILTLRFYEQMTQARIAAEVGISQMHVSRLLRKALTELRAGFLPSPDPRPAGTTRSGLTATTPATKCGVMVG